MKLHSKATLVIGSVTVGLIVLSLIWIIFLQKEKPPQFLAEPVAIGNVEKTVLASGTLEPFRQVSVGAQVSGQVVKLHVELGQQVKQGDLIAEIDSASQKNNLLTAQANLNNVTAQQASAEATLIQKQAAYERQKTLFMADAGSKADYDAALAEYRSAQSSVSAIKAQVASAKVSVNTANVNLGYTRITAPMDGTVISIVTKQGQTVNANQSAPTIVVLGALNKMTVKAEISEADVIKVKAGMKVYFTILGDPARKYYATLRTIEPANTAFEPDASTTTTSTSSAVYYYGLFDVDNPEGTLRTSMTAQVYVILESAQNVLTIPATALGPKNPDGSYMVMVVKENSDRPEPRTITVGVTDGARVQILSGLKAGDKIVTGQAGASGKTDAASSSATSRQGPPGGGLGGMGGPPGGGGPPG
ncbi:efflux RND transporter periplasmic adaptor subunit [Asticcacaulis excentricus]|nr:efflux RND transporter periplasmic adaptor subunit [Asticcacaulis excentricus]